MGSGNFGQSMSSSHLGKDYCHIDIIRSQKALLAAVLVVEVVAATTCPRNLVWPLQRPHVAPVRSWYLAFSVVFLCVMLAIHT